MLMAMLRPPSLLLTLLFTLAASSSAPDVELDAAGADTPATGDGEDGVRAYPAYRVVRGYDTYGHYLYADDPEDQTEAIDESHVFRLTAANFSSFLAARRHVMVNFYAPWCQWSRKLVPDYAAATSHIAADLQLDVALAKVDATDEHDLAQSHGVMGYPTILFIHGVPRGYRYYGERTKDAIIAWINKMLGPPVQNVTTVDEAEKIVTGGNFVVLGFLDSLSGAQSDELAAASRLKDNTDFYQTTNPDVAKFFQIDPEAKRPILVLLKKEDEKLIISPYEHPRYPDLFLNHNLL